MAESNAARRVSAPDPLDPIWDVLPPEDAAVLQRAVGPIPETPRGLPAPLAEAEDDPAPWLRREDESLEEYAAFQRYLALGTSRSVRAFVRQEAAVSGMGAAPSMARWSAVAARLDWSHRAAAHDEYEAGLELAAYREERLKLRRERQQVLRAYLRVMAEQIRKLSDGRVRADYGEVTAALKVIMGELRTEYLDQPDDRMAEVGRGGQKVVQITDIQAFMVRMRQVTGED